MLGQGISGYEYKTFAAAGTTVCRVGPGVLHNLFIPVGTTGTVALYDSATAAGTASTNLIFTIPSIQGTPQNYVWDWQFRNGLVSVNTGNQNCTLSYL